MTVKSRQKKMTAWTLGRLVNRDRTFLAWSDGLYSTLLAEVLGGKPREIIAAAASERHPLLLWAQVCAYEQDFPKDAHRQDSADRADYLHHLADLGYTLADVDQQVIDSARPRQAQSLAAPITPQPVAGETSDLAPADAAGETDADSAGEQDQEVNTD
jgi:hypothetical protein